MKFLLVILTVFSISVFSFVFKFDGWIEYDFDQPTDQTKYGVVVPFMGTTFIASGGFRRDNIVIPPYSDSLWNNYWYFDEGFFSYSNEFLELEVGVKQHPVGPGEIYKLFVEEKGYSYPSIKSVGKIGRFRVETLWGGIRLDDGAKPAKAFNYRALVFSPIDGLEIAYEDSVLYLGRYFDPYYYFVPIPIPGIQEFFHLNAPWYSYLNDNSMIGGWIKYSTENWKTYFELLIDDINMNRFLAPESYQNPDKIAFLVGFSGKSGPFRLTYEVAGATAYTFQRTVSNRPYEYVFFEGSNYPLEKNMIGYRHGENNIVCAIRFEYDEKPWSFKVELENVIHGTRTPDKPWHGGSMPSGTKWLIGEIDSKFSLKARIAYTLEQLSNRLEKLVVGIRFGYINGKPLVGADLSFILDFSDL
ncbi:hypothetical protein [Pseudothermotoga thermarum]|uniref:Capsule assembly protein Wzi n=1 Tax=Pseudothermotoga thermarum DSM 5069 TaxID=688269 RepID=F7YW38_9THEM|nr:hypothetical protein [Pseudothermotoga thermarum]AEH50527.1 hypothetical protein Theth_0432 [Pseudothermotoga thermarum DSM 5069]